MRSDAPHPAPDDRMLVAGRLGALAVACIAALTITWALAIRTETGQRADEKALEGRVVVDPETLDAASNVLDTISVGELAFAGGALIFIGLVRGRVLLAGAVGVAILGANVTTEVLKKIVIERPDLIGGVGRLGNSFPSGHSTVAMSLAVAAVLVAPRRFRGTAAVIGVAYAAAVAVAVLVTGWHRPSDAIGAAFVAVGWGAGVAAVLVLGRGTGRRLPGSTPLGHRPAMWVLLVAGTLALTAVAVVVLTALFGAGLRDVVVVDDARALVLAVAAIVGTDLVMIGLLLASLRRVTLDPPATTAPVSALASEPV